MALIYDQRKAYGATPQTHVLIIGVSAYPNLPRLGEPETPVSYGMCQLSSTALSAFRFFEWITAPETRLTVPLGTVRMLLLPSDIENKAEPALSNPAFKTATVRFGIDEVVEEAEAWRADAGTSRDNCTFFYFAGHGVQRTLNDAVMLLPEFGGMGATLARCIDTRKLRDGMAPTPERPSIARMQCYFVDACRLLPEKWKQFERMDTYPIFDPVLSTRDDRRAPVFYAAIPGSTAYGISGEQTLFNKALLDCLRGLAGEPLEEQENGRVPWQVSVHSLDSALDRTFRILNAQLGADQDYDSGSPKQAPICYLTQTPQVDLELHLQPAMAAAHGSLVLKDFEGKVVFRTSPVVPHPLTRRVDAGDYTIRIKFGSNAGYADFTRNKRLMPPKSQVIAKCE